MKLKLIKKVNEAKGTQSFFWEPENKVDFLPGQYFYYTLPKLDYPDNRGPTRHFTIASSPTESYIQLTTRIREQSGYKKTLSNLPVGSVIEGEGPQGTFVFDNKDKDGHVFTSQNGTPPNVLIAGGIGITPFRSMLKYHLDNNLKIPARLIYSNSDSDFIFKSELEEWKNKTDLKIDYFDTSITGHLNPQLVSRSLIAWGLTNSKPTIWLVGPPPFINSVESIIEKMKVTNDLRSEKFIGY
jgi:glycine betaine catabolism B